MTKTLRVAQNLRRFQGAINETPNDAKTNKK